MPIDDALCNTDSPLSIILKAEKEAFLEEPTICSTCGSIHPKLHFYKLCGPHLKLYTTCQVCRGDTEPTQPDHKVCRRCGVEKNISTSFRVKKDGYIDSYCIACCNKKNSEWRAKKREEAKAKV
jgi:hypothetical protein